MDTRPTLPGLAVYLVACLTSCFAACASGGGTNATRTDAAGLPAQADAAPSPVDASAGDTSAAAAPSLPSALLDLTNWKLTLPIGEASKPTEVAQPALASFVSDPHFVVAAERTAVQFRAHAGGVTTSNSGYPRSELREMNGKTPAAWTPTQGIHTMVIRQAITHLPEVKPHAVAGQIHDASDDVIMIRLEGRRLFVEGGGQDLGLLDAAYGLGTFFTVKVEAADGRVRVYYDDMATPKVDVARSGAGYYFKAGVYTQSNVSRGDQATAYGEVLISSLTVTHK